MCSIHLGKSTLVSKVLSKMTGENISLPSYNGETTICRFRYVVEKRAEPGRNTRMASILVYPMPVTSLRTLTNEFFSDETPFQLEGQGEISSAFNEHKDHLNIEYNTPEERERFFESLKSLCTEHDSCCKLSARLDNDDFNKTLENINSFVQTADLRYPFPRKVKVVFTSDTEYTGTVVDTRGLSTYEDSRGLAKLSGGNPETLSRIVNSIYVLCSSFDNKDAIDREIFEYAKILHTTGKHFGATSRICLALLEKKEWPSIKDDISKRERDKQKIENLDQLRKYVVEKKLKSFVAKYPDVPVLSINSKDDTQLPEVFDWLHSLILALKHSAAIRFVQMTDIIKNDLVSRTFKTICIEGILPDVTALFNVLFCNNSNRHYKQNTAMAARNGYYWKFNLHEIVHNCVEDALFQCLSDSASSANSSALQNNGMLDDFITILRSTVHDVCSRIPTRYSTELRAPAAQTMFYNVYMDFGQGMTARQQSCLTQFICHREGDLNTLSISDLIDAIRDMWSA